MAGPRAASLSRRERQIMGLPAWAAVGDRCRRAGWDSRTAELFRDPGAPAVSSSGKDMCGTAPTARDTFTSRYNRGPLPDGPRCDMSSTRSSMDPLLMLVAALITLSGQRLDDAEAKRLSALIEQARKEGR